MPYFNFLNIDDRAAMEREGLDARLAPQWRRERAIIAEIEARLGLDAGSIGVSHTVNPQTWTVAAIPQPDAPEA